MGPYWVGREMRMDDVDLDAAIRLYRRACWEFMDSVRKGRRNDAWFDLSNAIHNLWPEVDPDSDPPKFRSHIKAKGDA